MNIINDFLRIKEYLGLPEELELHVKFDWNEGFYRSNFPAVMVGVKGGYNRRLLVHECLHAFGLGHYDEADFGGSIDYDKHSERIEKQIFSDFLTEGDNTTYDAYDPFLMSPEEQSFDRKNHGSLPTARK